MRTLSKIFKITAFTLLTIAVLVIIAYGTYQYIRDLRSKDLITIKATFMQYACGDDNDDMQVQQVSSKKYKFLVGRDIDPDADIHQFDFKEYFYSNKTDKYGMQYCLKGYLSEYPNFGCDNKAPKFWVEEMERIDGRNNVQKKDF
jgi:hypothetical protein